MTKTFSVELLPSNVSFECSTEETILDGALKELVTIEHSCKTGECGVCQAELLSGTVINEHGGVVSCGKILTCQSKVRSSVQLSAKYFPELSKIKPQTLPCKLTSIEYLSDVVVLKFKLPTTASFEFIPGQYIDLIYKGVRRSYSLARNSSLKNHFELHVRKVTNGAMSSLLFSDLSENQLMRIEGPKGTFFVRSGNKPIVFLATGTGIAPVLAMVERLIEDEDPRKIHIYWGGRWKDDFYLDLDRLIALKHNNICHTLVSSRENDWSKYKGYIQDALLQDFIDISGFEVYACGSPTMIESARNKLFNNGLPKDAFYYDAFTPAIKTN